VAVQIPVAPATADCSKRPAVSGTVRTIDGKRYVLVPIEDADVLRKWITDEIVCAKSNEILLRAHIEKLENRLKAVQ